MNRKIYKQLIIHYNMNLEKKPLEELIKEKWIITGNKAGDCMILANELGYRIIYNLETKEIVLRYSVTR